MGATSLSSRAAAAILLVAVVLEEARRHGAGATEYTVGDSAGWTNGPNYLTWSQKYNFTAGDTLGTYCGPIGVQISRFPLCLTVLVT